MPGLSFARSWGCSQTTLTSFWLFLTTYSGVSSLGVPGVPWRRSVNPISTRGDRLCPPNYYWHTWRLDFQTFRRPCYYLMSVDKNQHFLTTYPPFCKRSLWTTPYRNMICMTYVNSKKFDKKDFWIAAAFFQLGNVKRSNMRIYVNIFLINKKKLQMMTQIVNFSNSN